MSAHPSHPFTRQVAEIQDQLRTRGPVAEAVATDQPIVPNLYLSWGGPGVTVRAETVATAGSLLDLRIAVTGNPDWFSLNIGLGPGRIAPGEVFGLAVRAETDAALSCPAFLRSLPVLDGRRDTEFPRPLEIGPGAAGAALLYRLAAGDHAAAADGFHTLVLRLPPRNLRLRIEALRAFVLPARPGLATDLPSLARAFD